MIGQMIWRISSRIVDSNRRESYINGEETFAKDILIWWLDLDKYDHCWTWRHMKVVLRC